MATQEVMAASFNSFISQECDTDIKFSLKSHRAKSIPPMIQKRFIGKSEHIQNGYFNSKYLPGDPDKKLRNMVKYCFEPHRLTADEASQLSYFNRTSRSSLYPEQKSDYPGSKHVSGLSIVVDNHQNLVVAYFALPSSTLGYRKIFYRRWKGMGFEEAV